jgi:hypothetical protein
MGWACVPELLVLALKKHGFPGKLADNVAVAHRQGTEVGLVIPGDVVPRTERGFDAL